MRTLVVLRPGPGAGATAVRAAAMGLSVVQLPLFDVRPVPWSPPDAAGFDLLLVTSANAIRHGGAGLDRLKSWAVAAVGAASAETARRAGFSVAYEGLAGVDALLADLPPDARLLHLAGRDRSARAPTTHRVTVVEVYEAVALPVAQLTALPGAVVAVHSARAASRLDALAGEKGLDRSNIALVALSEAVGRAAGGGWERVVAPATPDDAALLALAALLCL